MYWCKACKENTLWKLLLFRVLEMYQHTLLFHKGLHFPQSCAAYLIFFFRRLLMKSLHSAEISSKASSSKSQVQEVTLASVSLSLSPMKGDRPLTLVECSGRESQMSDLLRIFSYAVYLQEFVHILSFLSLYCDGYLCSHSSLLINGRPHGFYCKMSSHGTYCSSNSDSLSWW